MLSVFITAYLVWALLWPFFYYSISRLLQFEKSELSKLFYSVGEKTIFSALAILAKGIYDTIMWIANSNNFDHYYVSTAFFVLALGIYLIKVSKKIQGDQK